MSFFVNSFLSAMRGYSDNLRENPNKWIPKIGDKVVLTESFFENMTDGKECMRLAKLDYCTVAEVNPIIMGDDDNGYEYEYEIYIEESEYLVGISYIKYK